MDTICLISAPHAGTERLGALLGSFTDIAPQGPLFAPDGRRGIDPRCWPAIRQLSGIDFEGEADPRLATFATRQPGAWLNVVQTAGAELGRRRMSFPLRRGDLPPAQIEQDVAERPGLRLVIVMRKQIDVYVATMAAAGTTGAPLRLDIDAFEAWMSAEEDWFGHWQAYLARRYFPCPVLRYEFDIDQPGEGVLRRFAAATAQVGIALRAPVLPEGGLPPPPARATLADSVADWPAFNRAIFARGLERRAFGYPLATGP